MTQRVCFTETAMSVMLPELGQYTTCTADHGGLTGSAQVLQDHAGGGLGMKESIKPKASIQELASTSASSFHPPTLDLDPHGDLG